MDIDISMQINYDRIRLWRFCSRQDICIISPPTLKAQESSWKMSRKIVKVRRSECVL